MRFTVWQNTLAHFCIQTGNKFRSRSLPQSPTEIRDGTGKGMEWNGTGGINIFRFDLERYRKVITKISQGKTEWDGTKSLTENKYVSGGYETFKRITMLVDTYFELLVAPKLEIITMFKVLLGIVWKKLFQPSYRAVELHEINLKSLTLKTRNFQ